ncbi:hypothetical protein N7510_009574 [Penicillium lagena]|uniref:uncharacterized protein n=1 Tax=Penicillium lagena TaxID=94218 RepID=UPI002542326A|nr:uncharacterized protein N7510_009574 [Penicillium lagena]KAJ5604420.1 hypothetical protein N7510_009574 [Penicillium lagena]
MSPIAINVAPFQRAKVNLLQPEDSKSLKSIIELLLFNAQHNPDHVFCLQLPSKQNNAIGNAISITHQQFYHAVNYCAQRLQEEIGIISSPTINEDRTVTKCSPVVLFLESNVGLLVHLLALLSLGVPVAVLSARLSPTAVHHLLSSIRARSAIVSPRLTSTMKEAIALEGQGQSVGIQMYVQRPYEDDLEKSRTLDLSAIKIDDGRHFVSENDRNVLILHSSGTTGLPKPIYQPHRYLLNFAECHQLGKEDIIGSVLSALPLFHPSKTLMSQGFGLVAPCLAMGAGKPFMLPPSNTIPTGSLMIELIHTFTPTALMTVPHILEEITALAPEQGVNALRPLEFVLSGGGPLKNSVAEILATSGVSLLAHFGTTECGPLGVVSVPAPDYDWHYWQLRQDINYRLDEVDASSSAEEKQYKLTIHPFGWDSPFELQDILISRGAEYRHHLRAAGRKDDLIVLVNGEKVIPRILESLLMQDRRVKSAVAFGEGRFEIGVIIESSYEIGDEELLKTALWPIIVEAGEQMDSHARISSPASIIFASPEKPIPRSDKGSILRRETYRVYEEEIADVYRELKDTEETNALDLQSDTLEMELKDLIQREIGWKIPPSQWDNGSDLFELGMNSLQAMRLHRLLLYAVPESQRGSMRVDLIYRNPSVSKLATALRDIKGTQTGHSESSESDIDEIIRQYSLSIQGKSIVLLTGSTGNLGSSLLAHFIASPTVEKIICLNRRPADPLTGQIDLLQRQLNIAESKGVSIGLKMASKIEIIPCDPTADLFGLSLKVYTQLISQTTHILHNAWPMDFKRSFASFQSQFQYLNSLIRLSLDIHNRRPSIKPRLLFVSSIAVVGQYPRTHGTCFVPEVPSDKASVIDDFGYGQAKYVCEEVLRAAAKTYPGLELGIVRVGQMSGSSTSGYWNPKEHIPTLVKFAGMTLSWIPMDAAAAVLGDILFSASLSGIYHLENPIRQAWQDILDVFASCMDINTVRVPFNQWLSNVQAAVEHQGTEDERMELHMLSDFFEKNFQRMATGRVILDTSRTRAVSRTLREVDEVSTEVVSKYVSQWRRNGTLGDHMCRIKST